MEGRFIQNRKYRWMLLLIGVAAFWIGMSPIKTYAATPEEELAAIIAEMEADAAAAAAQAAIDAQAAQAAIDAQVAQAAIDAQAAAMQQTVDAAAQVAASVQTVIAPLDLTTINAVDPLGVNSTDVAAEVVDPAVLLAITQAKIAETVQGLNEFALEYGFGTSLLDRNETTKSNSWTGSILTKRMGAVFGPIAKEVYYNLKMDTVVEYLQASGFVGEYWVRNDGVKMYGPYVMCAADYETYPFGTTVETTLGTAIVCDTGTFGPEIIDIATIW